jgi:hypothetical protein
LSKQVIPIAPHMIGLRLPSGPSSGLEVRAHPVRLLHDDEALGLAVAFVKRSTVGTWIRRLSAE